MPFEGGIDSLSNGTLLLACAAAVLCLAMEADISPRPTLWRRTVARTAGVALLAVLAVIEQGPWLLVVGLALSAAGDALLAQDGERPFAAGLASQLAGYLAYVALLTTIGSGFGLLVSEPWRLALVAVATMATALLLRRLMPAVGAGLRGPAAAYAAVMIAMLIAAATVPGPLVVAGAALFVVSYALLGVRRFLLYEGSGPHRRAGPAVWVLYFLAQMAITLGVLL